MPFEQPSIDFTHRAAPHMLPELMDGDCTYEQLRDCLRSLQQINRWLLGYRPTLAWLGKLPPNPPQPLHILDVGSGAGDMLRHIAHWAARRKLAVQLTGIDLNPHATRTAIEFTPPGIDITWITGNALTYRPEQPIDLIVSSLTAHHLEDDEIVTLLRWMDSTARLGWFFNDLERSQRSYHLYRLISRLARWHPFTQHDGLVSIRRAFRDDDWHRLLAIADIPQNAVTLEHWRPGRLCVSRWKHSGAAQ